MVNAMFVYFFNQGKCFIDSELIDIAYAEMNTCRGGKITSPVTWDYLLIICEDMLSQTTL